MKRIVRSICTVLVLGILVAGLTGCDKKEGSMERTGREMDKGAEKAVQKIDKAIKKTGEKIEKTGDRIKNSTK